MAYTISTANSSLEYDTSNSKGNRCCKLDDNHFFNIGTNGSTMYAQVFEVNTSTFAVSTASSIFDMDEGSMKENTVCCNIDSSHVLIGFKTYYNDAACRVFEINTSTWAISTQASTFEYRTDNTYIVGDFNQIDTNHFLSSLCGVSGMSFYTLEINTSTWAISTQSSSLNLVGNAYYYSYSSTKPIDDNHFIVFTADDTETVGDQYVGLAQVITVNTSTWAITTANSGLEFDTQLGNYNSCYQIDTNHFLNVGEGGAGDGKAQVFTINTSTGAVTTAGSVTTFTTDDVKGNSCCQLDSTTYVNYYSGDGTDGFTQVLTVNTSNGTVSTSGSRLEFDTQDNVYNSCCEIDSSHCINFGQGVGADGYVQTFEITSSSDFIPIINII